MKDDASPDILLGHTLDLGSLGRRKLTKVLGGGATALVFLGVEPNDPENKADHVAVKVARPELQWREALEKEWRNLTVLAAKEKDTATHYFPRVRWPDSPAKLQVELYLRHPERGWSFFPWVIMVQELVHGQGVHDLLLHYPELRLPEPLALAIAEQYVEMLTILHRADLTCADRKLADLRWQEAFSLRPGDATALARWQQGKTPGHLMVLDWNVTERADQAYIGLDLFRFGILWHRLLLGSEPRFGREWRLEEPLYHHPAWRSLSTGTQQILSRLFHPRPENRYQTATILLADLRKQIGLWRKRPHEIWAIADSKDNDPEERWAAIDLLRVLSEAWDARREDFHDFDRLYSSIQRDREERPFRELRNAFARSDWPTALKEAERLAHGFADDPARSLQADRYRHVAEISQRASQELPDRAKLQGYIDRISTKDGEKKLKEDEVAALEKWKEQGQRTPWAEVLERLWAEAKYPSTLGEARDLHLRGEIAQANERFRDALELRKILQRRKQIIGWLDELFNNPEEEAKAVARQAEELTRITDLLRTGLQAIINRADGEEGKKALNAALWLAPAEAVVGCTYRLLLTEEAWHRVEQSPSLAARILYLGQWRRALFALRNAAAATRSGRTPAEWPGVMDELAPELEKLLQERQTLLRGAITRLVQQEMSSDLAAVGAPMAGGARAETGNAGAASDKGREAPTSGSAKIEAESPPVNESLCLLISLYREAFSDNSDGDLDRELQMIMQDWQEGIKRRLASLRPIPQRLRQIEDNYRLHEEASILALYGQRLAEMLGQPWPAELRSDQIEARKREAQGCLLGAWSALGRYLQAS